MTDYADIILLRYTHQIRQLFGPKLYFHDLEITHSIRLQAQSLCQKSSAKEVSIPSELKFDIVSGSGLGLTLTKIQANRSLSSLGLDWDNDVEDLYNIRDSYHSLARGSYRHAVLYKLRRLLPKSHIIAALRKTLRAWPILRSIQIESGNGQPLHLIVRPTDLFISQASFDTEAALLCWFYNSKRQRLQGSLMFRATIVNIRGQDSYFIVFEYNHAVCDAMINYLWYSNLDSVLHDPRLQLETKDSFKLFSDITFAFADSTIAKRSTDFMYSRLRRLPEMSAALWPPLAAPDVRVPYSQIFTRLQCP